MDVSKALHSILAEARRQAIRRRQVFCSSEQVLETLLLDSGRPEASRGLTQFLDRRSSLPFAPPDAEFSRVLLSRVLPEAEARAAGEPCSEVRPNHLLATLLGSSSPIDAGLREEVISRLQRRDVAGAAQDAPSTGRRGAEQPTQGGPAARVAALAAGEKSAGAGSWLLPISSADADGALVERPELLDRLMLTLMFSNPLLVGPIGSGRRSLVRLLAMRFETGRCPEALEKMRLLELDPTRLVAGTSYRGELEERVQQLLRDLLDHEERAVLVVPNVHLLVDAGRSGGAADIASALVPHLKGGEIKLVASASQDLVREHLEKNPAFLDCLTVVPVHPPDASEAKRLLVKLPERLSRDLVIEVAPDALDAAISLSAQHLPHVALPGAAEKIVRGAAATLAFESSLLAREPGRAGSRYWNLVAPEGAGGCRSLGERHVMHELSQQQRIPFEHLESGVAEKLRDLDQAFGSHIFGQDHVLEAFRRTVKVALMNLADPARPRGRLFFLGPPGTGKSECAKLLAKYLMGHERALLRFDMSEFQERASISTLLGSDKGLVNSEEGGRLTEPLRENPHRVILFDEIEKADASIFNLFLQVLEYGEIHDKRGCPVSFRNAICIFTSNVGCRADQDLYGLDRQEIVERLKNVFRPEFLDRIEEFVPFRALGPEPRRQVAAHLLGMLREQMLRSSRVDLAWSAEVLQLASTLPTGEAGVRNVRRWVEQQVKPAIADALLVLPRRELAGRQVALAVRSGSALVAEVAATADSPPNSGPSGVES